MILMNLIVLIIVIIFFTADSEEVSDSNGDVAEA